MSAARCRRASTFATLHPLQLPNTRIRAFCFWLITPLSAFATAPIRMCLSVVIFSTDNCESVTAQDASAQLRAAGIEPAVSSSQAKSDTGSLRPEKSSCRQSTDSGYSTPRHRWLVCVASEITASIRRRTYRRSGLLSPAPHRE